MTGTGSISGNAGAGADRGAFYGKGRRVIVISEDALIREDLETLKKMPNFQRIWDRTARVDAMRSVYPSVTYPCHASMATGVYPDRHGVINNEQARVGELSSKWMHFRESVKARTVFDVAKAAGLTTAGVFWPVSGLDPSIDWLVDEYWPQAAGESYRDCFAASGSSGDVMRAVVEPNLHMLRSREDPLFHPAVDRFIHACACATIRAFRPELLMVHPANVDAYRHQTGVFSEQVTQGLYEIDMWFGDIVKAAQDAGVYDDTNFFIVSDHGQMNIERTIAPNVLFAENGLITLDKDQNFVDYAAYSQACALSAQVFLKDPSDAAVYEKTHALLRHMCDEGIYGISRVYTAEEALREEHLSGGFSFVLETDGYTAFSNDWKRPLVRPLDITDYRFGRATHGYQPDKGPQPTMFAFGPDIEPGAALEKGSIVDLAPTFAHALGLSMPDGIDGRPLLGLFRSP
ncbi:MAG: alkaline phosphatase family protein [Clostridiales bacterium]|nr:alkaline phosphatase family protein [Clostridiales bacterium]